MYPFVLPKCRKVSACTVSSPLTDVRTRCKSFYIGFTRQQFILNPGRVKTAGNTEEKEGETGTEGVERRNEIVGGGEL